MIVCLLRVLYEALKYLQDLAAGCSSDQKKLLDHERLRVSSFAHGAGLKQQSQWEMFCHLTKLNEAGRPCSHVQPAADRMSRPS